MDSSGIVNYNCNIVAQAENLSWNVFLVIFTKDGVTNESGSNVLWQQQFKSIQAWWGLERVEWNAAYESFAEKLTDWKIQR